MQYFDDLEYFKNWWMQTRSINTPIDNALSHVADTHGVVLYRQKPYQVELFNVKPNSEIPPHKHPNVDSFEVYVSGDINFMCNGEWNDQHLLGQVTRVYPSNMHGGLFGQKGGCFLSIQKWLNDKEPEFVGNDWADTKNNGSYEQSKQVKDM